MVLAISLVALLVPNFAVFLSLVGSSVYVVLSFVLPAMFHCMVFREELGWRCVLWDGAIAVLGFVIAVTGTFTSVMERFFGLPLRHDSAQNNLFGDNNFGC